MYEFLLTIAIGMVKLIAWMHFAKQYQVNLKYHIVICSFTTGWLVTCQSYNSLNLRFLSRKKKYFIVIESTFMAISLSLFHLFRRKNRSLYNRLPTLYAMLVFEQFRFDLHTNWCLTFFYSFSVFFLLRHLIADSCDNLVSVSS